MGMDWMFVLLELLGFLLPAIVFSLTGSQVALYAVLLGFFVAHRLGLPSAYKRWRHHSG